MNLQPISYLVAAMVACLSSIDLSRAEEAPFGNHSARPDIDPEDVTAPEHDSDVRFQSTYIWQRKSAMGAAYSGDNSLAARREPRSFTLTGTMFAGTRVWQGGELYFNPEITSSESLSGLHGLGGLTNGENQKGGGVNPKAYVARLFLRQTWGLGGGSESVESAPNQLGGTTDHDRMVLTVGKISLIDIFDSNAYSHDPRTQFLNWTLMASGAFDYAADSRGYTTGIAYEYYTGNYVFRYGRFMQPRESNGLPLDPKLLEHYGDQVEIERSHEIDERPGKVRLLMFHNRVVSGSFQDAINAWQASGSLGIPSVSAVRKGQDKFGIGINAEQSVTRDIGVFLRASANDGKTETYAFTEVERSLAGGFVINGAQWGRAEDAVGMSMGQNGISRAHRDYLANGGLGAFIGDGPPPSGIGYRYAPERIFETYYSFAVSEGVSASLDFQRAQNPAYNAMRGPANFIGVRLHAEI